MRKIFSLLWILTSAMAVSCSKEREIAISEEETGKKEAVTLTFSAYTDETKTTLSEDYGILWQTWDKITVFNGPNASVPSTFVVHDVENDGKKAIFVGLGLPAVEHYAVSPAQDNASISGEVITAFLPQQQGVLEGSFGPQANLSAAVSDAVSDEFYFRNCTGIISLQISDYNVTGIRLESLGDEKLSGEAKISFDGDGIPVIAPTDNAHSWVTLSGELTPNKTYYFAVFPGLYSQGLRITLYKNGQYASIKNTKSLEIGRCGYVNIGTLPSLSNWKTPGTVTIKGDGAEDGQEMAYAGNEYAQMVLSRNRGSQIDAFANDEYNYEAFTSLKAGLPVYFSDGEQLYGVFAGTVVPISSAAEAPAAEIDEDGVYRVRLNLPFGKAYFQKITAVEYNRCGNDVTALSYAGNGVWTIEGLRLNGSDDRYKFHFTIDEKNQVYGRMFDSDKRPGQSGLNPAPESYWYVQPAVMDTWEPGFKFPQAYYSSASTGRYYADLRLYMNAENSHYTHELCNFIDSENLPDIDAGEAVYIQGEGALDCGQKLAFIDASWTDTSRGDGAGDQSAVSGPDGYNYEIFTKLEASKTFYFVTSDGHKFALNSDASAVEKIASPTAIAYDGVAVTGVYRIRMNFATGVVSVFRVDIARLKQPSTSYGGYMTYAGNGTWKIENFEIKWKSQSWNSHEDRYKFDLWFSYNHDGKEYVNTWQDLANLVKYDRPSTTADIGTDYFYVQPYAPSDWNGCFKYPDYLCGETPDVAAKTATVKLILNGDDGKYIHSFTAAEDAGTSPNYVALSVTSLEETFTMHKSAYGDVFEGVSTFATGETVNMVATDALGRKHNLSTTSTVTGPAYLEAIPATGTYTFTALPELLAEGNAVLGFAPDNGRTLDYAGHGVYYGAGLNFTGSSEGNTDAMTPTYPYSKNGRARFTFIKPDSSYAPQFRRLNGSRKAIERTTHGSTSEMQINPGTYNITVDLRNFTFDIQPAHDGSRRITVMGSSVPTGTGATADKGYMYLYGTNALTTGWTLSNRSVPGNNTTDLATRYDDLIMDGGKYVVYALSLGNEGIHGAANQEVIFKQWKNNMQKLVSRARNEGRKVVVMGNYGRGDFNAYDYSYVKAMNLEIHQWNVPSMNVLGAVDDEAGHWPSGYQNGDDVSHPNDAGHAEMAYAMVPSVFDAMEAGKPLPVRNTSGELDLNSSSVSFAPESTIHPFTVAFYVRTYGSGDILRIQGDNLNRSYNAETLGVNDGAWHLVAITHYYAKGITRVYVDDVEHSNTAERIVANSFTLSGGAFRELFFWRSAMNSGEISAVQEGKMLKSSLEIYAPFAGGSLANLATSTNDSLNN
ncbi:MAG: SGNH/GDSL hydrolase family protein [Bacteroidales bacterium]|nr:SGNH/GDSL hydrolase family protein [Bacteroidales bacterium]